MKPYSIFLQRNGTYCLNKTCMNHPVTRHDTEIDAKLHTYTGKLKNVIQVY